MGLDMYFHPLSKGTVVCVLQLRNAWHIHDWFGLSCNEWDVIRPELITSFCQEVKTLLETRVIDPDIIDPPEEGGEEKWWEDLQVAYDALKDIDEELLYYGWV